MQTIHPTIYRQRVLPAKFTQQMLPAITADTTAIHKMIEEQYGKTVISFNFIYFTSYFINFLFNLFIITNKLLSIFSNHMSNRININFT